MLRLYLIDQCRKLPFLLTKLIAGVRLVEWVMFFFFFFFSSSSRVQKEAKNSE